MPGVKYAAFGLLNIVTHIMIMCSNTFTKVESCSNKHYLVWANTRLEYRKSPLQTIPYLSSRHYNMPCRQGMGRWLLVYPNKYWMMAHYKAP